MLSTHGFSISNSFLKNIKRYPSNVDNSDNRIFKKSINLSMKWLFNKGMGSMTDLGGIGSQGEYYYIQSKRPTLKAPSSALGKERSIPIFPRNQVLAPLGEEYLGVYEMRYRQLLYDVGEGGLFGHIYYSHENQKLALVGTLTRVRKTERLDDGGIYVLMEGVGRFYMRDVLAEKPYLKAGVQIFNDYSESPILLDSLEQQVFEEVRYSVKIMKLLYPQNNYTMNEGVLKYRPPLIYNDNVENNNHNNVIRNISMEDETEQMQRRSSFSFATMDMLKTDPVTKVLFLQEPVLEKRYKTILEVLKESTAFLEGELCKRGIASNSGLKTLRKSLLSDMSDLDHPASAWVAGNYNDGDWEQSPVMMD